MIDNWIFVMGQQYADFRGRSERREFWLFFLANWLLIAGVLVGFLVAGILSAFNEPSTGDQSLSPVTTIIVAGLAIVLATMFVGLIVPSVAVAVRRLHDSGLSGWLLLLGLIPFGGFVLLVFYVLPSEANRNQYGPATPSIDLTPSSSLPDPYLT